MDLVTISLSDRVVPNQRERGISHIGMKQGYKYMFHNTHIKWQDTFCAHSYGTNGENFNLLGEVFKACMDKKRVIDLKIGNYE